MNLLRKLVCMKKCALHATLELEVHLTSCCKHFVHHHYVCTKKTVQVHIIKVTNTKKKTDPMNKSVHTAGIYKYYGVARNKQILLWLRL